MAGPVLDPAVIDRIRSLQKPGRPSVLRKLTRLYLDSTPQVLSDLCEAVPTDAKATQHKAHRLKGSSVQIGARQLANLCKELEELGRSGKLEGAEERVERIESEYARVREALSQLLEVEPE